MILKSEADFLDRVKVGDIVFIHFAHTYKNETWSNWITVTYVYNGKKDGLYLFVSSTDQSVYKANKAAFMLPSLIFEL